MADQPPHARREPSRALHAARRSRFSHELVIDKSAPSLFHDTEADTRLRARGIRTLVLAGVATDIGIDFTARHAMALGYFAVVAEDAVGGYTAAAHEHAMAILRPSAFVAPSDEIISCWSACQAAASGG